MPRRQPNPLPPTTAARLSVTDEPGAVAAIATAVAAAGGRVRSLTTMRRAAARAAEGGLGQAELEL